MATVSITTDYIFNEEDTEKLIQAMEASEHHPVAKRNIESKRVTDKNEIKSILDSVLKQSEK